MAIRKIIKRATDALFTNPEFDGTEAARQVKGTTGERASAEAGDMRFNTTLSLMEYYDGVQWKSIDAPPLVSSISPSNIADSDSDVDIVITGSNFSTSPTVTAIGSDSSVITPTTVVRDSATQITATFDGTDFSDAQEDYGIKVENTSGLSNTLGSALAVNASPVWTVASGSLGTFGDIQRTSISITTGATDDEGASLTYSVSVGSLPTGLSLNTSTGAITGTATAVGSDTTSNFTLSVTDGVNTTTRAYSITVNAPVVTSYTSTGSGTFSVPTGTTAVDVLVVAGGGGGGNDEGGGGGAGGLIYRPAFPVTPGGSVSYTVGGGGGGGAHPTTKGANGSDSLFGTLTAKGGGGGGTGQPGQGGGVAEGSAGGSGGGSRSNRPDYPYGEPSGTQPQQPGDSGTYGFGSPGGDSVYVSGPQGYYGGGGGGGAGGSGQPNSTPQGVGRNGGVGKQYGISGSQVYYAGGGGGAGSNGQGGGVGGQGGGGNGGAPSISPTSYQSGTANRGGGGGSAPGTSQGNGGSGIVIVKY